MWEPSPDALAAASPVPYDVPPQWTGPESCAGNLRPGARALGEYTKAHLGVRSVSGYSCVADGNIAGRTSMHGTGRAIDLMHPTDGAAVADWLIANSGELGVQLVIWDHGVWQGSRGARAFSRYTGPNPHTDHVHVELTEAGAARAAPGLSAPEPSPGGARVPTWLLVGAGLVALFAVLEPKRARALVRAI